MKLRVKFRKYGPIRFIGHLDVMRFFQKAIRRAEIDIAYSAGFSPHQIMSFAAPLGVGLESNGEYMDIEVNSVTNSQDMIERLNRASVEGIEVVEVRRLPDGAGNAMASVAAAAYTVRFREGLEPSCDWKSSIDTFLQKPQILITKETKKGTQEVDLKPGIFEMSVQKSIQKDNEAELPSDSIHLLVDASSAGNIKPSMVMEALLAALGETLKENSLLVTREETYTNVGTAEEKKLVPLGAIGEDIV